MEAPLILAEQLMQVIRGSGLTKEQSSAALQITGMLVTADEDLPVSPVRLPAVSREVPQEELR